MSHLGFVYQGIFGLSQFHLLTLRGSAFPRGAICVRVYAPCLRYFVFLPLLPVVYVGAYVWHAGWCPMSCSRPCPQVINLPVSFLWLLLPSNMVLVKASEQCIQSYQRSPSTAAVLVYARNHKPHLYVLGDPKGGGMPPDQSGGETFRSGVAAKNQ